MKTLIIKNDLSEVERVREFLKNRTKGLNLSEEDYFKVELPLVEMCINSILYAYPEEKGEIHLKTWGQGGKIYFEIRDWGVPFDPTKVEKPDIRELINDQKKGGLGIFLSRKLMDGFSYKREDNQNVLIMYKKIKEAS